VGENPAAAQALGFPVVKIRYCAVAFGGLLAGFAGWIAVALVVFGTWKTGRVAFGAILFGMVSLGELIAQSMGANIPSQFLSSLPYIVTIVVLAIISTDKARMRFSGALNDVI